MPAQSPRAAFLNMVAAWNARRHDDYLAGYAPSVVMHDLPPGLGTDLASVKQYYGMIWAAFADTNLVIDGVVTDGDTLAARYHLDATHVGEFMGIPATGKPVRLTGMTFIRFDDGKICERWNNADMLGLLAQLHT